MVDHANRERPPGEIKVGGHQASSASMVAIMTALWFGHLGGGDKVAVKPHASPVYHAIKYLTGELDRSYLTRLRALGGLQSYPSRTKDPDVVRLLDRVRRARRRRPAVRRRRPPLPRGPLRPGELAPPARFIALAGDAELDEGNVWEAITEPALQGLGNVMWVVDTNRQSLDRVVPDQKIKKLMEFFDGAGWHVVEAKYGHRAASGLRAAPAATRCAGTSTRCRTRSTSRCSPTAAPSCGHASWPAPTPPCARVRRRRPRTTSWRRSCRTSAATTSVVLLDAYRACDAVADRPSVVFAYTVKGWGLPIAGDPLNHSALLSAQQIDELRDVDRADAGRRSGTASTPSSPEGRACADDRRRAEQRARAAAPDGSPIPTPPGVPDGRPRVDAGGVRAHPHPPRRRRRRRRAHRHDVAGRQRVDEPRRLDQQGRRVRARPRRVDFLGEDRLLRWQQSPAGRHIELGISEMNLFLLLHALGLGHDLHGHHLLPIGTVYDPFVCRGLDALIYGLYSGSRFVVVGTPAGITLAPEGGAHQSTITPSIGLELPGLTYAEPAFARALDWLLCDGLADLARARRRLAVPAPVHPAARPVAVRRGRASGSATSACARDVLAGGYRLREPDDEPAAVVLATCGPVVPEVLAAAEALDAEGAPALVLDLT